MGGGVQGGNARFEDGRSHAFRAVRASKMASWDCGLVVWLSQARGQRSRKKREAKARKAKAMARGAPQEELEAAKEVEEAGAAQGKPTERVELRDQGYTRPRVLVLMPFRSDAFQFVESLVALQPAGTVIHNKVRFQEDFGDPDEEGGDGSVLYLPCTLSSRISLAPPRAIQTTMARPRCYRQSTATATSHHRGRRHCYHLSPTTTTNTRPPHEPLSPLVRCHRHRHRQPQTPGRRTARKLSGRRPLVATMTIASSWVSRSSARP